jgi:hypothetical protein
MSCTLRLTLDSRSGCSPALLLLLLLPPLLPQLVYELHPVLKLLGTNECAVAAAAAAADV